MAFFTEVVLAMCCSMSQATAALPQRALPSWLHEGNVSYLLPEKLGIWPCDSGVPSTGMMALKDWSYLLPPQLSLVPADGINLQRSR